MLIVYYSLTGNTIRFLNNCNYKNVLSLQTGNEIINEQFILISSTINFGEIPDVISKFMKNNYKSCIGIIGSGNKNWGSLYCNSVKLLNKIYNIPILMTFELSGKQEDINKFKIIIKEYLYTEDEDEGFIYTCEDC